MNQALNCARRAAAKGEVPVGAVLVQDGEVLAEAGNRPISDSDPTAHAEVNALRAACLAAGNYRLPGSTLYVTLEPCMMCVGAIVHARVDTLVFAAREPKAGAVVSAATLLDSPFLNHRVQVIEGPCADDAAALMSSFFADRRRSNAKKDSK